MPDSSDETIPAAKCCSILIVEDDDDLRDSFEYALRLQGYSVRAAADGHEALERLASARPDLILLDLVMPQMDGLEFPRQLKQWSEMAGVRVVIITAFDDPVYELKPQFTIVSKP